MRGVPNDQDLDNAIEAIVVDAYGADEQHSAFRGRGPDGGSASAGVRGRPLAGSIELELKKGNIRY
jgi:hypothetical protein